uniref:Ankyrin repeat and kinase domain containing 1 n=1 Tax=Latimeria chalumnae TaxID=7897 RepID=H3BFY8_LATCH
AQKSRRLKLPSLQSMAYPTNESSSSLHVFERGDFELDWTRIATGGFGHVYKVKHKLWRTSYAVKCYPSIHQEPSPSQSCSKGLECLMEEAAKMGKLKFKHIVPIYGITKNPPGIVMEYMANGSLEKLLGGHIVEWHLKFRILHEIALGINFLHSLKPPLLHLDLKPGNVLMDDHFHAKISDFGLSKWMEHSTRMECIERSAIRGTLSYLPPEMFLQSTKAPGPKNDVYSFGIVMWETLTQKKPYPGCNMMAIIIKVVAGKRPSPEIIPEDRPMECEQMINLLQRCWDHNLKRRPSFSDICSEIEMLLSLVHAPLVD